jgi:hypothetical protein
VSSVLEFLLCGFDGFLSVTVFVFEVIPDFALVILTLSFGSASWLWLDTFAVFEFFTGFALLDTTTFAKCLIRFAPLWFKTVSIFHLQTDWALARAPPFNSDLCPFARLIADFFAQFSSRDFFTD